MPLTMQEIVDRARIPLNDSDSVDANRRWPDAELLKHAKSALQTLLLKRPDLFFGSIATFSAEALVIGSAFPLGEGYAPPVIDWVTARAETKDDESVSSGAAASFFSLAQGEAT